MAHRITVPWPGIKPMPLAVEVHGLNNWTTREVWLEHLELVRAPNFSHESWLEGTVRSQGEDVRGLDSWERSPLHVTRGSWFPTDYFCPFTSSRERMTIWTSLCSFTLFWILECLKHLAANFHPKGATWQYDHFLVLSGSLAVCTHMYTHINHSDQFAPYWFLVQCAGMNLNYFLRITSDQESIR